MRARIGYAPEHHDLPAELTAADLVRHLAELHLLPPRAAVQRANDALWLVGLGEERFRHVGSMSTGQRQRVKLAAAIAHDPELVLLDEPTDGLDPVQRTEMLDLIRRIGTEFGLHIVISSHHLQEVERICDSVVIVEGGVVVHAGTLADLRRGPAGLVVEVDERADELAALLTERTVLAAASLAACAYAGLFVAAGLWFRRAVWWGLAFVLLWENAAAHASDGTARFTVTSWARSILSSVSGVDVPLDGRSVTGALVVLPAVAVAGWPAATGALPPRRRGVTTPQVR